MKVLFISLGCDKNLADSEEMLGLLTGKGHEIVDAEEEAEVIVINTCFFCNLCDWQHFALLCNFDVTFESHNNILLKK